MSSEVQAAHPTTQPMGMCSTVTRPHDLTTSEAPAVSLGG